jgi:WD40 repeat protein
VLSTRCQAAPRATQAFAETTNGGSGSLSLQSSRARKRLGTPLHIGAGAAWSMALSADSKTIAVGYADGTVSLWDGERGQGRRLRGRQDGVTSVAFDADGKTLASGSGTGTVLLWNVTDGTSLGRLPGRVYATAFTADGKTLAFAGDDGTVRFWDVAGRRERGTVFHGAVGAVESLAYDADGKLLAAGNSGAAAGADRLTFWDVAAGESRRLVGGQDGPVSSLAFSRDGKTLAVGGNDATVTLWDVTARKPLGKPLRSEGESLEALAFTPDDKRLVAAASTLGGGANIVVWDGILWTEDYNALRNRVCGIVGRKFTQREWADFRPGGRYLATCPEVT